jgi:hypothetical protein
LGCANGGGRRRPDIDGALRYFQDAAVNGPRDPWLLCRIGLLRLRRSSDAERAFSEAFALDVECRKIY